MNTLRSMMLGFGLLPAVLAQAPEGSDLIRADKLKSHLTFIASDQLEGRDTPSRGLSIAAEYIAAHLSQWGVKPMGDNGTYFQKFPIYENRVNTAESYCELQGGRFAYGDFISYSLSGEGTVTADVVYVQHGWVIARKNIDPYKDVDVRGKIVVVHRDYPPKGLTLADIVGKEGTDFELPWDAAHRRGAKAVIYIPSFFRFTSWREEERRSIELGYGSITRDSLVGILGSMKLLSALFKGEKHTAEEIIANAWQGKFFESFALKGTKRLTIKLRFFEGQVYAQNVVGLIEGTSNKNEYVAIGAHYDHIGVGLPVNGDAIYNGADDDGSGTVGTLAIAEAFSKTKKPKRSILLVWHSGEEKDLWGSRYIANHPPVPIGQIVTQLNIDMIGRSKQPGDSSEANADLSGPNEVYVIGSKVMSTELGQLSERVNKSYLNMQFNYKYDDPNDPEAYFTRSDHFNYAQKGVPIIFYFNGSHEDYHQPSDSVEKIDFSKLEKIARTVYATAREIANGANRPKVDKKLPDIWVK